MMDLTPKLAAAIETLRQRLSAQDWKVLDDELRKMLMQKAVGRLRPMNTREHMHGSLAAPHPN